MNFLLTVFKRTWLVNGLRQWKRDTMDENQSEDDLKLAWFSKFLQFESIRFFQGS